MPGRSACASAPCQRYGLIATFPADDEEPCNTSMTLPERGLAISRAMERVMRTCDAMIVNLTPFRGQSADVDSAYEMGFRRALGRPIFAYINDERPFFERVVELGGGTVRERPSGVHEDGDGMVIEPFILLDSLMLEGSTFPGVLIMRQIPKWIDVPYGGRARVVPPP